MIMNWRRGVAAVVALTTLCGTAQADTLTAGRLWWRRAAQRKSVLISLQHGQQQRDDSHSADLEQHQGVGCIGWRYLRPLARAGKDLRILRQHGRRHLYLPGNHQRHRGKCQRHDADVYIGRSALADASHEEVRGRGGDRPATRCSIPWQRRRSRWRRQPPWTWVDCPP
jgi:hypothetical protein